MESLEHQHYFFKEDKSPNFVQGKVVCVICGLSHADVLKAAAVTHAKVTEQDKASDQEKFKGFTFPMSSSARLKTAAALAEDNELSDVEVSDAEDEKIHIRCADDVFYYEAKYGDAELSKQFLEETEEAIRRIEAGELDPSDPGAF